MLKEITKFQKKIQALHLKKERVPDHAFYLYLSMISSVMHQGYNYQQDLDKVNEKIKRKLSQMNVKDVQSLDECIHYNYQCGDQYQQFLTFWDGTPCFDIETQKDHVKQFIKRCEVYAK